jgi:hypothetical protein
MILSENRNALFRIMLWYRTSALQNNCGVRLYSIGKTRTFCRTRMASAGFAA